MPVSGLGEVEGTVGEKVDAVELFGLTLRLLELAAEQLVVAVDHQLKRGAACLQPLHLLLEGADFLLELADVVGLHHALPDSAAQQQRRERLVVVVRDAILRQSSDFTISVEPDRGHIAEQFVDDAPLLLSARTQDLLAPGAGDAQGEGRLAAAPGVLGKVIQGVLKGAAGRGQNLVAIGCGDVDAGAVRHIAEEVDTAGGLIGAAWSTQVITSTIIGRYRQWILRQVRDVGVAQELPVERGRGLAIDGPHHVAGRHR